MVRIDWMFRWPFDFWGLYCVPKGDTSHRPDQIHESNLMCSVEAGPLSGIRNLEIESM